MLAVKQCAANKNPIKETALMFLKEILIGTPVTEMLVHKLTGTDLIAHEEEEKAGGRGEERRRDGANGVRIEVWGFIFSLSLLHRYTNVKKKEKSLGHSPAPGCSIR